MAGYTPLFDSLANGSLCGKWPDIGLWAVVLSQADKGGVVDKHPTYLAAITGLPVEEIEACMKRFCAPDPASRTKAAGGARLELLDPAREWGWRIVNHGQYREKARLMGKDQARTESGEDAARKRRERASPDVPRIPPDSPSHTQTHTQTQKRGEGANAPLACPHEQIVELYHRLLPANPRVRHWTEKRKTMLLARWREDPKRQELAWWERFFAYCAESEFLTGRAKGSGDRPPFLADLEWLVNSSNIVKVLEGKYHREAA